MIVQWLCEVVASPLTLAAFMKMCQDPKLQALVERRREECERAEDLQNLASDVEDINKAAERYSLWEVLWSDAMIKAAEPSQYAAQGSGDSQNVASETRRTMEGAVAVLAIERTRRRRTLKVQCAELMRRAESLGVAPALSAGHLCYELCAEY